MAAGDASLPYPIRNVAYRVGFVILDADGDPVAGAGGLDSEFSVDAGNFADCASEASEVNTTSGMYVLDVAATEMNGSMVMLRVQSTTAGTKTTPIVLYPRTPVTLESGTLTAGTTASATLTTAASTANNFYNGCVLHITSGNGAGQGRVITAYTGASQIAVVTPVFASAPSSTSGYSIYLTEVASSLVAWHGSRIVDATTAGTPLVHATNTVSANVVVMATNTVTDVALQSAGVREIATDVMALLPTGTVGVAAAATVATVNANTLTASALASDAAREIAVDVMAVLPTGTVGTASVALTAQGTVTANVVVMATNTVTDVALQSAGVREIAVDVMAVLPTGTVGTASVALTAQGTVTANVVAMGANTLTASALASDAAREMATDAWVVGSTAAVGTATLTLTVGTTAISAVSFAAGAIDAAAVAANAIGSSELAATAVTKIADGILVRNINQGGDGTRTVEEALALSRNRAAVVTGTLTVFDTDDATPLWTAAVTTAAGNPIVEVDPA